MKSNALQTSFYQTQMDFKYFNMQLYIYILQLFFGTYKQLVMNEVIQ